MAVPVAAPVYAPAPKPIVITRPKPAPVVRTGLKPFDCVCARSASGKPVKVYNVASHRARVSVAKVGGGKRTMDVRGFHQGHWRVSYTPMGESGVQYGWVRQADLTCKETRAYPARYYGRSKRSESGIEARALAVAGGLAYGVQRERLLQAGAVG